MNYIEGYLKIDERKIHYYRTGGQKPPFVLLHGATDNGLCWTPVAEWLAAKYDVIMPDAPGHGKSERLTDGFKPADSASQMVGLINQLKLTKPIIMGHSMGAGTTANIAVNYPDVPKGIVLEDPAWQEPVDPSKLNPELKKQREEMMKALSNLGRMSKEEIMAFGRKSNPTWSEAELIPWAESKSQFEPDLFKHMRMDGPTYKELVPKMNCPTLLIIAETGIVNPESARQAEKLWKSQYPFKWIQIMGAGHNIRREQFEKFKEVVATFLNSLQH